VTTLHLGIESEVFSALCWKIGTPIAYKALKMAERGDWLGILTIDVKPASYRCPKTYLEDKQIVSFFKKYPDLKLGIDLEKAAKANFYGSEAQCFQTNERLNPLLDDLGYHGEGVKSFVKIWRKKIKSVLRRAPLAINLNGRFGPGSTFLNLGDKITLAHKLTDDYSATRQARFFLQSWDQTAWSRYAASSLDTVGDIPVATCQGHALYPGESFFAPRDFAIVRGNRFTTVTKDATKHRGICIEPSLNVFYQLAVGETLTQRMLRHYGWDKKTCQEFHKTLARIGSLTGAVATIDLSNASDTVCYNLVKLLLPHDWFALLMRLRSPFTFIDNKWVRLEKFSSMGNGYTFELETLLFRTLCETMVELEGVKEDAFTPGLTTSVFGDDIIVPSSISKPTVAALKFFGFEPNQSKTFLSGTFRESCGGDYMAGHDVRPHFQKEVCDQPHRLIALANGLRRFGTRHNVLGGHNGYLPAWFKTLDSLPRQIRICRGPETLGDLVIHDEEHRWLKLNPMGVRSSIRYLRVWRPVSNQLLGWEHFRPGVVLAVALYGGSSGLPSSYTNDRDPLGVLRRSGIVPRIGGSYVRGYRFGRVAYS
jgi:hypothetical protein